MDGNWTRKADAFARRHPGLFFLLVLGAAFLAGPFMIAANGTSAVLYKNF